MSFSVSIGNGAFEWIGRTHDVFSACSPAPQHREPALLGMLLEILRFQKAAQQDLRAGRLGGMTLGDYIAAGRYSDYFRDRYIVPMGAAIWSTRWSACSTFRPRISSRSSRTTNCCTGSARCGAP